MLAYDNQGLGKVILTNNSKWKFLHNPLSLFLSSLPTSLHKNIKINIPFDSDDKRISMLSSSNLSFMRNQNNKSNVQIYSRNVYSDNYLPPFFVC